ncbi:MAG: lipopolysaccharide biosynthesis protein [Gammaproteobacteria bacterium]|nr:MAG: lipopolysaccharide biosynthesis protein [Gammaproteobacteria bacterium]
MNFATDTLAGYEDPQPGAGLAAQLEAVRRRALPMAIAFGAVLALALLIAAFWPATYRAAGTILIEQQEIPQDFVRSAVSSYADQRVQVISQRVMTSANLLEIIERFGLYGGERAAVTREALLQRMREDIRLDMISADVVDPRQGRATKATIAFAIGFESRSPDLAARVANDLVTLYLRENLQTRKELAEGSTEFLAGEAEKLRRRIVELEQRIAEFKQKNVGRLPEFALANLQQLERASGELREVEARIRALDQQVVFLDAQLAQVSPTAEVLTSTNQRLLSSGDRLKVLRAERTMVAGRYSTDHPDLRRLDREIAALELEVGGADASNELVRRLAETRARLATESGRLSPEHPDVRRLEAEVASLEQQLAQAPDPAAAPPRVPTPDNPVYIQIGTQRQAAASERAALQLRRAELQARIAGYEGAQLEMPAVELEYGAMVREAQGEQAKYAEIRQKQMAAELAQNLETEQKGERFTLIEPPLRPEQPTRPNRPLILVLGLLLAGGAAFGTMVLLEAVDTRVRGRRELVALLGSPPLAIIPWIAPEVDEQAQQVQRRWILAGAAGSVVVAVLLVHILVKPLDVLWVVLLRRLAG